MNEIKTHFYKNLNFLQTKDFLNATKSHEYFFDKLYIEYQKLYNTNCSYKNIAFEVKDSKNILFCPATIESKNSGKNLNFFGRPFLICHKTKHENIFQKDLLSIFSNIVNQNGITNFMLKKYIDNTEINKYLQEESENIDAIYTENRIDLQLPLNTIFRGFTKGHKSSVKKEYPELNYKIYDHRNYQKNQIFEMMELHHAVANKKTRSKETWLLNEEMIIKKQGFLIKVMNKDQLISYAFFFHNKYDSFYFSSCTIRETFNLFKNISHKSIWKAIEYLKKIKCSYLTLDNTKTLYYANETVNERSNMERFKASFGGNQQSYIVYKKMPKKFINLD